MPYFFILPALFVLLVGLGGAFVVTCFVPRFRPASAFIAGGTTGLLVGFVVINLVVMLTGVAPAWLAQRIAFPNWLQQVARLFVAATLLIGPIIGLVVGVVLGAALADCYLFNDGGNGSESGWLIHLVKFQW